MICVEVRDTCGTEGLKFLAKISRFSHSSVFYAISTDEKLRQERLTSDCNCDRGSACAHQAAKEQNQVKREEKFLAIHYTRKKNLEWNAILSTCPTDDHVSETTQPHSRLASRKYARQCREAVERPELWIDSIIS